MNERNEAGCTDLGKGEIASPIPFFVSVGPRTLPALVLVHFQATFFLEVSHYLNVERIKKDKRLKKTRALLSEGAGHKTGDDLLSRSSVAALPSAIEGLTSVFGMGTCVSPHQ